MQKILTIIILLFSFILINSEAFSQTSEEDVRAAYIYQFPNYIDWQKEFDQFRIGCFTTNEIMINKLKYIADTRKIYEKDVVVEVINKSSQLVNTYYDILYFDNADFDIDEIILALNEKKTLLITNNIGEKPSIMINFLPSIKEGLVRFEVNKKVIVDRGMIISPDILLLGGTFVDVRELFHEKERELENIETKLTKSLLQIKEKQNIIDNQDYEIIKQNNLISQKTKEINGLNSKLNYQQYYLDSLVSEVRRKQSQIKISNKLIADQLESIDAHKVQMINSKREIDSTRIELDRQESKLTKQNDQIESQKKVLSDQLSQIQLQYNLISGGVIIVLLVLSLVYFIYRGLRQKKKANARLKEANDEVLVQNEEIKAQREEILTARDQLAEINNQLESRNEELDKYRLHLEDLVKQRTEDLVKEKEKAEEASRMKTSFIENMSHEIRTPMNAILGFTKLVTTMNLSDLTKKEYVGIININADTLMRFINDLIDLSNIESGEIFISKTEGDINKLMNELFLVYSENLKNAGRSNVIKLIQKIDDQPLMLNSDHLRLKQVLENLLSNALKFTKEGSIEFGYEKNSHTIRFYVKDTGIGIPEDKHDFIFERFSKIEDDTNIVYRGVGIGLSISKSIVEALNGKIELNSKLNEGSEFSFIIPIETE